MKHRNIRNWLRRYALLLDFQNECLLKVTIDKANFLPADSAGGVELYAKDGKIRVVSTLESRLELLSQKVCSSFIFSVIFPYIKIQKTQSCSEYRQLPAVSNVNYFFFVSDGASNARDAVWCECKSSFH